MKTAWKIPPLFALLIALLCVPALAGDVELLAMTGSGQCGKYITWNLNAAGKLIITGRGDFYGENDENYLPWRNFGRYIVDVTVSDGIAAVPDYAFRNCDYLESVTLGKDVKSIGQSAFENCSRLTGILSAGSLETIGEAAFAYCPALTDFDFAGVKTIGEAAFDNSGLVNLIIPDSVQEIGESAFGNCMKLESISIGQGVTYLDSYVFSCPVLKTVTIPVTVTAIDENAFHGNDFLTVYYAGTAAQWDKIRGGGADSLAYQAWKIHFESTGPENAAPMTFQIKNVSFRENRVNFTISAASNGIQNLYFVVAYYEENGRFIDFYNHYISLPRDIGEYSQWQWNFDSEKAAFAKIMFLDGNLKPIRTAISGTVEH